MARRLHVAADRPLRAPGFVRITVLVRRACPFMASSSGVCSRAFSVTPSRWRLWSERDSRNQCRAGSAIGSACAARRRTGRRCWSADIVASESSGCGGLLARRPRRRVSQRVAPFVIGMTGVYPDVYPGHLVVPGQLIQFLPEISVCDRFPGGACHPFVFHLGRNSVIPRLTYSESVSTVTWQARFSARSPSIAATSSMRLLVVSGAFPAARAPYRAAQNARPTSGSGVAEARTIGDNFDFAQITSGNCGHTTPPFLSCQLLEALTGNATVCTQREVRGLCDGLSGSAGPATVKPLSPTPVPVARDLDTANEHQSAQHPPSVQPHLRNFAARDGDVCPTQNHQRGAPIHATLLLLSATPLRTNARWCGVKCMERQRHAQVPHHQSRECRDIQPEPGIAR